MKIFGGDKITKVYNAIGADEDLPIELKMISRQVENAQKKVEGRNFTMRKNVLKYDDVMNVQREVIYKQRRQVLDGENLKNSIVNMMDSVAEELVPLYVEGEKALINVEALDVEINKIFDVNMRDFIKEHRKHAEEVVEELKTRAHKRYEEKEAEINNEEEFRELERIVVLKVVDEKWMDHIDAMDELKNGIGLRAYGQQDPVVKYRVEGMDMFEEMVANIKIDVVKILTHIRKRENIKRSEAAKITGAALEAIHSVDGGKRMTDEGQKVNRTVVNEEPKVGRNDLCPCGSGKKYKNCHGK
jgi:preprotein translocase subunit SecA